MPRPERRPIRSAAEREGGSRCRDRKGRARGARKRGPRASEARAGRRAPGRRARDHGPDGRCRRGPPVRARAGASSTHPRRRSRAVGVDDFRRVLPHDLRRHGAPGVPLDGIHRDGARPRPGLVSPCARRMGSRSEPRPYLRRAVVNACNSHHRRARRQRQHAASTRVESVSLEADEMADAIAALPYRQRAAIVMRFWHDCSEVEIAARARVSPRNGRFSDPPALAELRRVIP